jgi:hypothetical protein
MVHPWGNSPDPTKPIRPTPHIQKGELNGGIKGVDRIPRSERLNGRNVWSATPPRASGQSSVTITRNDVVGVKFQLTRADRGFSVPGPVRPIPGTIL